MFEWIIKSLYWSLNNTTGVRHSDIQTLRYCVSNLCPSLIVAFISSTLSRSLISNLVSTSLGMTDKNDKEFDGKVALVTGMVYTEMCQIWCDPIEWSDRLFICPQCQLKCCLFSVWRFELWNRRRYCSPVRPIRRQSGCDRKESQQS